MKRTDHILTLVASALTNKDLASVLDIIEQYYSIKEIRKPKTVSLGSRVGNKEESLSAWISRLRSEQVLKVVFIYNHFSGQTLQPHIAAAFAGPSDLLLQVTTSKVTSGIGMKYFSSRYYEISPAQFIQLINSQPDPALLWARASTLVLDANKLNNRSLFPADKTDEYLATEAGAAVFDTLGSDLMRELQIEAGIQEKEFIIPESFQSLVTKYESSYTFGDDREYVYLYSIRDVSAEEVLALVTAQPFGEKIWETLNKTLTEYADPEMPAGPVAEWTDRIRNMDPQQLRQFVNPICRSICTLCEETNKKPIIPPELASGFGPDETDQKRAAARSKAEKNLWVLQHASEPWEYYQFQRMENIPVVNAPDIAQTHEQLMEALTDIQQFAAGIQSPFEEAFRLALFILAGKLPAGDYTEEHLKVLAAQLKENGFTERAIENFKGSAWMGTIYKSLGWKDDRIADIAGIAIADVFGGMGSWNDQYVDQDTEKYERLSAGLFEALRSHFAAILSYNFK
jgi:hypothetical protein